MLTIRRIRRRLAGMMAVSLAAVALCSGCAVRMPLETVSYVDLTRYTGGWYEIARIPQWYEAGCVGSQACYSLIDEETVRVVNTCRQDTLDGDLRSIEGTATVVDEQTNAQLLVDFGLFRKGDYYIIALDDQYQYAMVGTPDRNSLWILSREPVLAEEVYNDLVAIAEEKGFDTSRLEFTAQPAPEVATIECGD